MTLASLPQMEPPLRPEARRIDLSALRAELTAACAGEVRMDQLGRALYSTDASVYQVVPLGVVLPRSVDDVLAVIKICSCFGVPITARGGGTSQAGQSIGPGIILDCSRHLHRILEVSASERWVRVEPGCVLDDLNEHVKPLGLQFAPDISTANRATIGGMVANNSSGTHSLIHGKTVDHVLELTVALADGSVILAAPLTPEELRAKCRQQTLEGDGYRTLCRLAQGHADEIDLRYPKILRRVGGYNLDLFASRGNKNFNLSSLFVGSEGTLGIVLEARLRLVVLPQAKALLVVQFNDLLEALAATPVILKHQPAAVEVMDRYILDCTRLNNEAARLRDFLQGDPGAILVIEFYGAQEAELPVRLESLEKELRERSLGYHYQRAVDAPAQARIWKLRTLALGLSMAEKGDAKALSFVEDTAVAPERLRDYIDEFLQMLARHGTRAGVYAHASVGCLHVRPIVDLKTEEGVQRFETIAGEVAELVLRYGGALSGEHGDGLVRSPFQEKMYGPVLYQAFRELKRAFDPHNRFNPGKIVDALPLTANLRYGPSYHTPEFATMFDFSATGGLLRAAELCAGVGECRKQRGGTMCPSFQATREEQHSTRGRANTLRLALTGQLQLTGLTDPAVREALDLCLECKACKSECPTNVDMARLKAEVLHQHHEQNGLPWRSWIFGHVAAMSRWGSRLAPLSNWLTASRPGRWLPEQALGIDRRRPLPRFCRYPFTDRRTLLRAHQEILAQVVLFPDTFMNYYEPEIGVAVLELLARVNELEVQKQKGAARQVIQEDLAWLARVRCCGRPMISNGMLTQARKAARDNVEALFPMAQQGKPILACEPSCLLTIKDDYPALLPAELRQKAQVVAENCFTLEEYLEKSLTQLGASIFQAGPKRILVQGHCHQQALVGNGPMLRLLRRIPGAEVIDLNAGCCGMAGSFGYEKEHYDISRIVGEQRLFPALREADAESVIVAPGFSCRLQIEHFTGREAIHPVMLLRSLFMAPIPHGCAEATSPTDR